MWLWVLDALVSYKIIVRVHQELSFFVSGVAWNFHVGFLVLEGISLFFRFFFLLFFFLFLYLGIPWALGVSVRETRLYIVGYYSQSEIELVYENYERCCW